MGRKKQVKNAKEVKKKDEENYDEIEAVYSENQTGNIPTNTTTAMIIRKFRRR